MTESDFEKNPRIEDEPTREAVEVITYTERLNRLLEITKDPEVRKGLEALLRTGVNGGISVADLFPVVGDIASWTADACKLVARQFDIKMLDSSPDVGLDIALGSELLELCTGGVIPSHVIETTLQLRADWPRMKTAYERVKAIWTKRKRELDDPEVQAAIDTFEKDL